MSSLSDASASNSFTKGHLFIVFKLYFDGCGKDDGKGPLLVLAGYAAHKDDWEYFDTEWGKILARHPLKPRYIHMNEAFQLRKEFAKSKGWTLDSVILLARSLNQFIRSLDRNRFCAFLYTVDMRAYRMWRKIANLRPASEQCALDAFCQAYEWCTKQDPTRLMEKASVFYDRSESFLGHMHAIWTSKAKRSRVPMLRLINEVGAVVAENTPAVQACDMLAWATNRLRVGPRDPAIDDLCRDIRDDGLGTWRCDWDAAELQKRNGRIWIPPATGGIIEP